MPMLNATLFGASGEEEAGILKDATVFQVPEKLIHPSCFSSSYWLL
jgi:hypothetical protein